MKDPDALIAEISELPTLPDVVAKVNELVNSSSASAGDINDVISRDISLSSKVLKMVNSSFYGFPRRITSITHAVVILGFNTVRNLALSAFVFSAFKDNKSLKFDYRQFWLHSIGVGITANGIAQNLGLSQTEKEDSFMAGLLHDVGKVVMCEFLADKAKLVIDKVKEKDCLFYEAEKELLDFNHASLGGSLLEKWNLPISIVSFVNNHHQPLEVEENKKMCYIIHLADILTRSICIGNGGDEKIPAIANNIMDELSLGWGDVSKVMDNSLTEIQKAGVFLDML
ncbi:MAG: HDOD domain-containing protein [Planctomycetota bacterium]|jgi:putative nucleotidyltransferase with HDIG domain